MNIPTARDVMTRSLVTLRPETPFLDAISILLTKDISGAPVVDADGTLLGVLSEMDCLRVVAAGEFHDSGHYTGVVVGDLMSAMNHTIEPELDLYAVAATFVRLGVRRLPILENGKLIGQVSRRDVLAALDRARQQRSRTKKYPDYPEGRTPNR